MIEWKFLDERTESTGWRRVFSRWYELPSGETKGFDIVDHQGVACVLPITKDGNVVLVRQFRPGPQSILLELPGGLIDRDPDGGPDEDPRSAGNRELLE